MVRLGDEVDEVEKEYLRAIYRHGTVRAAARARHMSENTLKHYVVNIRTKMGLGHVDQILGRAGELGWLRGVEPLPRAKWKEKAHMDSTGVG